LPYQYSLVSSLPAMKSPARDEQMAVSVSLGVSPSIRSSRSARTASTCGVCAA
jgi:hypothetical protein